jgi:hypothetical protein
LHCSFDNLSSHRPTYQAVGGRLRECLAWFISEATSEVCSGRRGGDRDDESAVRHEVPSACKDESSQPLPYDRLKAEPYERLSAPAACARSCAALPWSSAAIDAIGFSAAWATDSPVERSQCRLERVEARAGARCRAIHQALEPGWHCRAVIRLQLA